MNPHRTTSNPKPTRIRPHQRFLLLFLLLAAGFYAITLSSWVDRHLLFPVLGWSAEASSALLNLVGQNTTCSGVVIKGSDFSVAVRRGCDPIDPIVLFGAAILAYPAALGRKAAGFLIGAATIFGLNLVRIATLYWTGRAKSDLFESLHKEWWPAFFILLSLALWLVWLQWVRKQVTKTHA